MTFKSLVSRSKGTLESLRNWKRIPWVFIYYMGHETEQIYGPFNIDTNSAQLEYSFNKVIQNFNHFKPKINILNEKAMFHQRNQQLMENRET